FFAPWPVERRFCFVGIRWNVEISKRPQCAKRFTITTGRPTSAIVVVIRCSSCFSSSVWLRSLPLAASSERQRKSRCTSKPSPKRERYSPLKSLSVGRKSRRNSKNWRRQRKRRLPRLRKKHMRIPSAKPIRKKGKRTLPTPKDEDKIRVE